MTSIKKRWIALAITVVMLMGCIPITASADEIVPMTVAASEAQGVPGTTVEVRVSVKNNPGFTSLKFLAGYDAGVLNLKTVKINDDITANTQVSPISANPVIVNYFKGNENYSGDAVIATFSFEILDTAFEGDYSDIVITFSQDDIFDTEENAIETEVVNGKVTVISCIPGDINGDEKVNNKDLMRLFQHLSGLDVVVNEPALDTNGDGKINNKDLMRLFQHLSGLEVELFPKPGSGERCRHEMTAHEAVNATCTEDGSIAYWECTKCGKLFADAKGSKEMSVDDTRVYAHHNLEYIPAKDPTVDAAGNYEYWHCAACGKNFLDAEAVTETTLENISIEQLKPDEYSIKYYITISDNYLQSLQIDNPNPVTYTSEKGVDYLEDLIVKGYNFEGWYTKQTGGTLVEKIPAGEKGNRTLYAHWTLEEYTITFDSPLVPVESIHYYVNTGATWKNPELDGYNFIGWCDDNNVLISSIPVGTTGNITLHANWTSKRNQTRPAASIGDPIILEDSDEGVILFAYEIGTIENVPIKAISETYQSVGGMKQTYTTAESATFEETDAKTIAKTVSNATSNSKAWSLSENWNDVTSVNDSYADQKGWTKEEAETNSKTVSGTYSVNSTSGGSSTHTNSSGISGTISKSNSSTIGGSATASRETGSQFDINGKYSSGAEVGGTIGIDKLSSVNVGLKTGFEIGASYGNYEKNAGSATINSSATGTRELSVAGNSSSAHVSSSSWNTSSGYSSSNSTSHNEMISTVLSGVISEKKDIGSSYSVGGNKNDTQSFEQSSSETNQYSSAITFSKSTTSSYQKTIELGGSSEGYYRFVLAGTAHVFAVIGFDVAQNTYFEYTYTIMDDRTYTFIDYSKTTPNFNDNEYGVLPFEVPYDIKNYVDARMLQSDGLTVSDEGIVTDYNGNDSIVFVPAYYRMDNKDGTYSSIKINGISSDAFKNKTDIVGVSLSNYITIIPDGAFENCSSLKVVVCPGIESIGANAFNGCSALGEFVIDEQVVSIGGNAFNGVKTVEATLNNKTAAEDIVSCGAENIMLTLSGGENTFVGARINVPASVINFELRGNSKTYNEIIINSEAEKTTINGISIVNNFETPINMNSEVIVLNRVSVRSGGYAAIIRYSKPRIELYGTSNFVSQSDRTIISRGMNLALFDNKVSSKLNVVGDIYTSNTITGNSLLNISDGDIKQITENEFDDYAQGIYTIRLDANGGQLSVSNINVFYGKAFGAIPVPQQDYYSFAGWYTEKTNGIRINSESVFTDTELTTLYAHWTEKAVSDWVKKSDMPSDAQIVETKWTYDKKSTTTSTNSSMSGWTQDGFNWSNWSDWADNQVSKTDNRDVETRNDLRGYNKKTQYNYSRYYGKSTNDGYYYAWPTYTEYGICKNYEEYSDYLDNNDWSDEPLKYSGKDSSGNLQYSHNGNTSTGYRSNEKYIWWYNEKTRQVDDTNSPIYVTQYRFRDKVFNYFKIDHLTSETYPSGENLSNIVEMVRYREK